MAFVAFASARPLTFFADQTDAPLGLSFGWSGISFAFSTVMKGQNYHRVRFFGLAHLNESVTDAWIGYKNGTVIEHLAIDNVDDQPNYFLADYRMNDTVWDLLTHEELWITVASEDHENGSVAGYFRCRPFQGVAIATADQVVGSTSNSSTVAIAWGSLDISTIFSLPQDILDQDTSIEANTFFNGRVLVEGGNATAITFNGPANTSESADALATATLYNSPTNDGKFNNVSTDADFPSIAYDQTYYEVTATDGVIRGQIYALLTPTRRAIPFSVDTVNGATNVPSAGFRTLRYANQAGLERNSNSYISLVSSANPTNFTYLAVFYFNAATNKKNNDLVRAITVEMNAKIEGDGTWLFEIFDSTNGEFLPLGTLTTAEDWTPAYIDSFSFDTPNYANNRGQVVMRVSVNSESQSTLFFDLFGIRSWTPSSTSNQALRLYSKILQTQSAEFANGTVVNESSE